MEKTLEQHYQTIREWATEAVNDWAKDEDESEVLRDCAEAYIDSELGPEHPQARAVARQFSIEHRL